jgi:hypothetical protein
MILVRAKPRYLLRSRDLVKSLGFYGGHIGVGDQNGQAATVRHAMHEALACRRAVAKASCLLQAVVWRPEEPPRAVLVWCGVELGLVSVS